MPTGLKTKFVERFSTDFKYMSFVFISLCIHFCILLCIFIVKLCKKMYSLVSNNHQSNQPLVRVVYNFVILSLAKIIVLCFACVWKRMLNFFISVYFAFFTVLLLSILYKRLSSWFQISDHSRLPFWLFFNNLSKNLITYPQNLGALMILNRPFTTVSPVIKI